jgi:1-pyrroline-5-carboxylate dehydrogenase
MGLDFHSINEPIRSYAPGSPERASLQARLAAMSTERPEIPVIIGGQEIRTGDLGTVSAA